MENTFILTLKAPFFDHLSKKVRKIAFFQQLQKSSPIAEGEAILELISSEQIIDQYKSINFLHGGKERSFIVMRGI